MKGLAIEPRVSIQGVIDPTDDALYRDGVLQTGYYNYYYSYGRHFRPKSVFEIGVRAGYTGYFIMLGSAGATRKYRGIDLEVYLGGSNARARRLLGRVCADVSVQHGNSHALKDLGDAYDLIHVDGDHTYGGKVQDLELAWRSLAPGGVVVVDDCWSEGPKAEVLRATQDFARAHGVHTEWLRPLCGSALNPTNGHILITAP